MNNAFTRFVATAVRAGVVAAAALAMAAPAQIAHAQAKGAAHSATVAEFLQKRKSSPFNLNAAPNVLLAVNQFQCAIRSNGDTCADLNNSPSIPGGFWPVGTPNAYMFNAGINMAGIIPPGLGFPWSGDTVAAFFFDATGVQAHGSPLTDIYNSLDPDDLANWPQPGFLPDFPFASGLINDTSIFSNVLIGRPAASQQDSYLPIWDGDPDYNAQRKHPMGVFVEQRTMAWNYPAGNEATIYFVYKVTNVTNTARFQQLNEARFFSGRNELPDAGWRIDSIYMAYDSDPDVTDLATDNFGTALLPLSLMTAYSGDFVATEFDYRPDIFFPPFFTNAPGMIGIKYLKSPRDLGLTMFSAHTNGGAFPDPVGEAKLFRYLKGDLRPALGDRTCTFPDPIVRKFCFLPTSQSDVRLFAASGPFSLEPGQSVTIVAAMYAAATVNTPLITRGSPNPPGVPSTHPGCGGDPVRAIEVAAGWLGATCPAVATDPIDQYTIRSVPGSLIGKGLAAQSVFDAKFLLPSAPAAPEFNLVPGDNQVTVIWRPSQTETVGDPFADAAADPDPTNPLRDPNFRRFDVEGYRIYKGTSPSNLALIAQFDKTGTVLTDFTCITDPTFVAGDVCPPGSHDVPLTGAVLQFPIGGVVRLANGSTLIVKADTAGAGQGQPLSDTGVPFAFIDADVRNGFRYFYKVTAFDVNSLTSGPTSLEGSGETRSTIPQKSAQALTTPELKFSILNGAGQPLNQTASLPTINAQTGTFSGPMPPTNSDFKAAFLPLVERLMPKFKLEATIDSVVAHNAEESVNRCANGFNALESCWLYFMTFNRDGVITKSTVAGWSPFHTGACCGDPASTEFLIGSGPVPADSAALASFGSPAGFVNFSAAVSATFGQVLFNTAAEGHYNRRVGGCAAGGTASATCQANMHGGSRWFAGTNESVADPAKYHRVGSLPGVDSIFAPVHHTPEGPGLTAPAAGTFATPAQCFAYAVGQVGRAADVQFTWGANGFSSVRDLTHGTDVRFSPNTNASWGFLNKDGNGNGMIDWIDFSYLPVPAAVADHVLGFCSATGGGSNFESNIALLEQTPRVQPVNTRAVPIAGMTATGQGFGLYVNGERYIFRLTGGALPASGTVWTLRTYTGSVTVSTGGNTDDPGGYAFTPHAIRPPTIPGLRFVWQTDSAAALVAGSEDLSRVHTVPDPYYGASLYDVAPQTQKQLQFVNVPSGATIRIYTLSGVLVDILNHSSTFGGGNLAWDLRNRNGQFVGSGVYLYHVALPDGRTRVGKFTVINSGG
jgi:hypothetical protein